ncbi:MAG: chemoreceptor glutamine deamidase CheD [Hydrogenophaga sp.]|nr:chemoreceptor glutamine deamidase CheD [Hydrogenophaga sp.]
MSASDALSQTATPLSRIALPRVVPAPGVVSRIEQLKARTPRPGEASFFFHDPHFRSDAVKVLPGEYYVSADELVIMTVLGSCIAACIWDPRVRVGGMNHFMLPEGGSDSGGRYGSYAMELLINELMKQGARRETMQAKVFGGGQVMSSFTTMNVGERNTKFVLDYLQTERIAVVSKDVLDVHPRKVCFFPATGKAMVKRLASSNVETLETQARKGSAATVVTSTAGGSIDLF